MLYLGHLSRVLSKYMTKYDYEVAIVVKALFFIQPEKKLC